MFNKILCHSLWAYAPVFRFCCQKFEANVCCAVYRFVIHGLWLAYTIVLVTIYTEIITALWSFQRTGHTQAQFLRYHWAISSRWSSSSMRNLWLFQTKMAKTHSLSCSLKWESICCWATTEDSNYVTEIVIALWLISGMSCKIWYWAGIGPPRPKSAAIIGLPV